MSIWQRFNGVYAIPMTLAGACMMLTGQPGWSPEAARAHMAAELARAPRQSWLWPARAVVREVVSYIGLVGLSICAVSGALGIIAFALGVIDLLHQATYSWMIESDTSLMVPWAGTTILWCIGSFCLGAMILVPMCILGGKSIRGPAVWNEYSYVTYKLSPGLGFLPEVVRVGVDSILKALPHAHATVFVLEQDGFPIDPVVEISCLNPITGKIEKAYPFVWDEHGTVLSPPQ